MSQQCILRFINCVQANCNISYVVQYFKEEHVKKNVNCLAYSSSLKLRLYVNPKRRRHIQLHGTFYIHNSEDLEFSLSLFLPFSSIYFIVFLLFFLSLTFHSALCYLRIVPSILPYVSYLLSFVLFNFLFSLGHFLISNSFYIPSFVFFIFICLLSLSDTFVRPSPSLSLLSSFSFLFLSSLSDTFLRSKRVQELNRTFTTLLLTETSQYSQSSR